MPLIWAKFRYYNVRGLWDKRQAILLIRIAAAHNLSDKIQEVTSLSYHVGALAKQGNLVEAEKYLPRLRSLAQSTQLPEKVCFRFQDAVALHSLACGDFDTALQLWQNLLGLSSQLPGQSHVLNRRWLATCLYYKGKLVDSQHLFRASLHDAERIGDHRSVIGNKIRLAEIDLDQGNLEGAAKALAECSEQARHYQDRRRLSEIQPVYARLHTLRGNVLAARAALTEAIDLFERLGMRRELAEARAALAGLDEHNATTS